ncbi:MAG: hypothetical protein IT362_04115 [Deltaproteobacteria bacterium]|nr:hypothetical protein [Deltaproteobacteria bacterium]
MVDELKTGNLEGQARDESRVSFLPEQQARVQELIDEAYRKAYTKAQRSGAAGADVDKLKAEVERLREDRKSASLLRAISRHSVVDAEEVTELLRNRVRAEEDGSLKVIGESGAARVNNSGQPMSIEEFVDSWLSERPHHLRVSASSGAGSLGARLSSSSARYDLSDPSSWRAMPREELDRLLKEGVDVKGAAGQNYKFRDVKNPFLEARKRKFQSA